MRTRYDVALLRVSQTCHTAHDSVEALIAAPVQRCSRLCMITVCLLIFLRAFGEERKVTRRSQTTGNPTNCTGSKVKNEADHSKTTTSRVLSISPKVQFEEVKPECLFQKNQVFLFAIIYISFHRLKLYVQVMFIIQTTQRFPENHFNIV